MADMFNMISTTETIVPTEREGDANMQMSDPLLVDISIHRTSTAIPLTLTTLFLYACRFDSGSVWIH